MGWRPFPYFPLSGTDIRYVTVHPSNGAAGKVRCTLHQAPLEDVDFDALSYVWGDPGVTETIILSGKPFRATTNLVACLKQLATRADEAILWVDAICINQNDVDERNVQVQRMKNIYLAARSVIAWLGSSTRLSRIGVQRLRSIDVTEASGLKGSTEEQHLKQRDRILKRVLNGEGEYGLRELLLRPYWHRTWVVQEIIFGQMRRMNQMRHVRFLCGEDEIPFCTLLALASLLDDSNSIYFRQPWTTTEQSALHWCILLGNFFDDVQGGALKLILSTENPTRPLQELLSEFRSFQCSDPRDRIYALLRISSDAETISPDYSKSTATVYSDVVHWHIGNYDSLDILSTACYHSERDLSHASWIPDWHCGAPDARGFGIKARPKRLYSCSKGLPVSSHSWSLDSTTGQLHLAGACLDTITSLSQHILSGDTSWEKVFGSVWNWMAVVHGHYGNCSTSGATLQLGLNEGHYPLNDNEPLNEACRRTLTAACDDCGQEWARIAHILVYPDDKSRRPPETSTKDGSLPEAFTNLRVRRRLAITSKGWIGLVQKEAELGDHVAVLIGADVPFILRKAPLDLGRSRDNEYTLIGDAYIHGLMHGKGLDMADVGEIILH